MHSTVATATGWLLPQPVLQAMCILEEWKFAGVGVIGMRELSLSTVRGLKVLFRWLAHSHCFCKMNFKLTLLNM